MNRAWSLRSQEESDPDKKGDLLHCDRREVGKGQMWKFRNLIFWCIRLQLTTCVLPKSLDRFSNNILPSGCITEPQPLILDQMKHLKPNKPTKVSKKPPTGHSHHPFICVLWALSPFYLPPQIVQNQLGTSSVALFNSAFKAVT